MTTYRYEEVKVQAQETGTCPVCGKAVRRSRMFSETINPLHSALRDRLQAEGQIPANEARALVYASVQAKAAEWVPDFTHETCR
jgi:hypothetical protein